MKDEFKKNINEKEARRLKARAQKGMGTMAWIGTLGIIGWSITLPLLIGIALGRWLERVFPGKYSFTLMFMFAGLVLGCVIAWRWVEKTSKNSADKSGDSNTDEADKTLTDPKTQIPKDQQ